MSSASPKELSDADVGMVTSYCPDGPAACVRPRLDGRGSTASTIWIRQSRFRGCWQGERVEYLPPTGSAASIWCSVIPAARRFNWLATLLGARRVAPLYGSVDPLIHRPPNAVPEFAADLSYLGTYAADRQETLDRLFIQPARIAGEPQSS